jgi:predicted dehydrogenase
VGIFVMKSFKNLFKKSAETESDSIAPKMAQTIEELWNEKDGPIDRTVTAIVLGCGQRGKNYSKFSQDLPGWLKIVGLADPLKHRRERLVKLCNVENDKLVVDDWTKLAAMEKLADCAIITTQDQMHKEPAIALAKKGYHLLLEKPMSVDEQECEEIAAACEEANVILAVCHVLRYFPPVVKIREIVDSGKIGEIVTVDHRENILWWHFAHSFVRGNWRNVKESTFSLLAKSCHDIDMIMYWMGDRKCTKIHSFGGLSHFKKSEAPERAGVTCFDCPQDVERACPYSAKKIYLERYF